MGIESIPAGNLEPSHKSPKTGGNENSDSGVTLQHALDRAASEVSAAQAASVKSINRKLPLPQFPEPIDRNPATVYHLRSTRMQ
jgi:hypothetical protein